MLASTNGTKDPFTRRTPIPSTVTVSPRSWEMSLEPKDTGEPVTPSQICGIEESSSYVYAPTL
nr:MAG TPA: hypothetical protein [Siphoviridae sp. ct8LQ5]